MLINRGLNNTESISDFLNPELSNLLNPFLFTEMEKAVERISVALQNEEKILVYGDYDVDGITSTSLLYSALSNFSSNIYYYIPDRFEEGYGISEKGTKFIIKYHISLIITVDCGITSFKEIECIKKYNIDTIITDHHEPTGTIPKALSIINPKSCDYPFKELAGVGVAFKLIQALYMFLGKDKNLTYDYLDLVALGTIADSVPVLGENRIFVKYGLEKLNDSKRIGIKKLVEKCRVETNGNNLSVQELSFNLIPVLNATGRIGNPKIAVDLLLTDSTDLSEYLVQNMIELNDKRKAKTQVVLNEAREMACYANSDDKQKILVLSSEGWHSGIIGIVASRIMEEFKQPVIMISENDIIGKGSGRNQGEFDFSKVLPECSDLLIKYGGHQYAAGITISIDKIDLFRDRINQVLSTKEFTYQCSEPSINIDSFISIDKVNWKFFRDIEKLEPFGFGNIKPIFGGLEYYLDSWRKVGKDESHLKLSIGEKRTCFDGIAFRMAEKSHILLNAKNIDIAFQIGVNYWNGKKNLQLIIKDIKPTFRRMEKNGSKE